MPRYRAIHTKIVESYDVSEAPTWFSKYLWAIMPLALDREGRGIDMPGWIRGKLFPIETGVTDDMIEEAMNYFACRGMVRRYQANGRWYFEQTKFREYQRGMDKESESTLPPPPPVQLLTDSGATPDLRRSSSVQNEKKNEKEKENADADADAVDNDDNLDPGWTPEFTEAITKADLLTAFQAATSIEQPLKSTELTDDWNTPLSRMLTYGVIPRDIEQAAKELAEKDYILTSPKSIEKAAKVCCRRRKREVKKDDRKTYITGAFANYIQH